ncbi:VOC family protein [Actinokineospora sp. G85]|uniref:VOC family protein n=1 Tax=Actinokineospora sp. G85 TaxID=3406626 RepID=UPI003C733F46
MSLQHSGVTIDSVNPPALAEFWTQVLGLEVSLNYEDNFIAMTPPGAAPHSATYLAVQRVAEVKEGKNRLHLDLHTDDRHREVARVVALGAKAVDEHEIPGLAWTVLLDPEGNEFCIGQPVEG